MSTVVFHDRDEASIEFFDGGSREAAFFRRVLDGAAASLVASGSLDHQDVRHMQARFDDRTRIDCGWPRIGVSGWKRDG